MIKLNVPHLYLTYICFKHWFFHDLPFWLAFDELLLQPFEQDWDSHLVSASAPNLKWNRRDNSTLRGKKKNNCNVDYKTRKMINQYNLNLDEEYVHMAINSRAPHTKWVIGQTHLYSILTDKKYRNKITCNVIQTSPFPYILGLEKKKSLGLYQHKHICQPCQDPTCKINTRKWPI